MRSLSSLSVVALLGLPLFAGACSGSAEHQAAERVRAFNAAITARNLDEAVALLAPGSVQFVREGSHADMGDSDESLAQDLATQWRVVGALLFSSTEAYERSVEVTSSKAAGDVATVWTRTRTETTQAAGAPSSVLEFSEVWLLLRLDGEWKIAGVANNRPATTP